MTADDECYDGAQLYLDYFACFKDEVKVVTELVLSPLVFLSPGSAARATPDLMNGIWIGTLAAPINKWILVHWMSRPIETRSTCVK